MLRPNMPGPRAARAGEQKYRDYFYIYPDRTEPDRYEATLPEVFPDFAPGSFSYVDEVDGWVWTTFNTWQWDTNWANPDVFAEYADIVLFLANAGRAGAATGRHRVRLEAAWHQLPESARGARDHPGAPSGGPDCLSGSAFQGRGDRRAAGPGALPRSGRPPRQGQRHRLPQQPDGAGVVDAGQPGCRPHRAGAAGHPAGVRRPPPGSPTSAATTTSAGPSTLPTRPRSG